MEQVTLIGLAALIFTGTILILVMLLGLITVGDALAKLLPRRGAAGEGDRAGASLKARDVMTRSVLCVSEEQPLVDAASVMVNRGVDQLPVVREGELVGFLTRGAILRLLFAGGGEPHDTGDPERTS